MTLSGESGIGRFPISRTVSICLALVVIGIGTSTQLEYIFGLDLGIDQLLFRDTTRLDLNPHPGRISPFSSLNFICVGLALLLLISRRAPGLSQLLAAWISFSTLVVLTGAAYGLESMFATGHFTAVSLATNFAFGLMSVGIFCASGKRGMMTLLTDRGAAGTVVRRLVPTAIFVPLAISGIDAVLERSGVFGTGMGTSIFTISTIVAFTALVWWSASFIRSGEEEKHRVQSSLQESLRRFTLLAETMPQIIWTAKPDGNLDYYNRRWFDYTGLTLDQTRDWGWKTVIHPADLQNCIDRWTESIMTGADYEVEYRFRRASDGSYRWHLGRAFPLRDEKGNIIQWVGTSTDIDDQKRARADLEETVAWRTKELARTKETLQSVLDSAAYVSIIATNPDGLITVFNRGAEEMLGYTAKEMVGKHSPSILHIKSEVETHGSQLTKEFGVPIQGFDVFIEKARQGQHEEREWTYVRKDGSTLRVNLIVTASRDAKGQIIGYLGIATDITARKIAEETLRNQALILDLANDTIFIRDHEDRITYWNKGAERLYGWTKEEALGEITHNLFKTEFPQALETIQQQLLRDGHWTGELIHTTRDGRQVTVASGWTLQRDDANRPISVIEMNYDITARKNAENELENSRLRLNAILNSSLDGLIVFEAVRAASGRVQDLRYSMVNPAAAEMMGMDRTSVIGRNLRQLFPNTVSDGLFAKFVVVVEEDIALEFEYKSTRHDPPRWYRIAGVRLGDGLVISFMDITARKQYEERLHEAKERAEMADSAKGDFLANMSHEIRTPMNGVIGMTGLLLDTELDSEQRNLAETIRTSADSLLGLLNDILDFSKIEAGKLTFEELDFDLRKVVEDTLELMAGQAQAKGIELVGGLDSGSVTKLRGDPGRVQQVLMNLVGNAIKFTQKGEVSLLVKPMSQNETEVVLRFEIKDTGIGISTEAQTRLFQPFIQADSSTSRKFGGTGLGLAICKRLTESMNGDIGVESVPGKGSTFWITLKFIRPSGSVEPESTNPFSDTRVLVVDDNETSRQFMDRQMFAWGMRDGCASTGEEALAKLHKAAMEGSPYALALIDMQMPTMDGLDLVRKINADPALAPTRIILLTPFGKPVASEDLKQVNVAACCFKPVRQSALFDAIAIALNAPARTSSVRRRKSSEKPETTVPFRKERILLAEDNAVNQQVALGNLRKLGFSVDLAMDGVEVLTRLASKEYDIILMDCQMPELDGYQVTREIRKREGEGHRTWIIAMTANVMMGDREKCLQAGMDDYVSKPLRRAELSAALERAQVSGKETIDQKFLDKLTDEDAEEFDELIELFSASAPSSIAAMRQALEKTNASDLAMAAHTLKGSCSYMGATSLREICVQLEEMSRSEDIKDAGGLVDSAGEELQRLIEALKTYRKAKCHD